MTHLHGIPLEKWVGRMMKCDSGIKKRNSLSRNPVKIVSFDKHGETATVHPSGHKGTEVVKLECLLPWWSRNNDLRIEQNMKPNIEIFHHLPVERFFGRRIKASLGDRGVCVVTLDCVKGDKFGVHWLVRGVRKEEWVSNIVCTPNWPENQDLLQESMNAKAKKPQASIGSLQNAFDQVETTLSPEPHKAAEPLVDQNVDEEPIEAFKLVQEPYTGKETNEELEAKGFIIGPSGQYAKRGQEIQKVPSYVSGKRNGGLGRAASLTPEQRSAIAKKASDARWGNKPTQMKIIKKIVVNIDVAPGWDKDFEELQKTLAAESIHRKAIEEAQKALQEHDGLVQLCVDTLTEKGVEIIWEGAPVFRGPDADDDIHFTSKPTPPKAPIALTQNLAYEGNGATNRFLDKIKELMEPGIRYKGPQLAEMVGMPFEKAFQNRLGTVLRSYKFLKSERRPGISFKFYYLVPETTEE